MRRRRVRKPAVGISLFPFLAVLVCTMGVLIVLLISLVQQARVYAGQVTERRQSEPAQEEFEQLQLQFDDFQWRREVLETQRKQLTDNLGNQRLQLGHLEEHIRRLEREWQDLQQQAASLEAVGRTTAADTESARAELARLQGEIERARMKQQELQDALAKRPRRFAIIPYDGPHGTQRRPIYIECTKTNITIQPEGIVLRAEDFEGPLGPGNPLDAALRTEREYLARIGEVERWGEPYPLLIVRPDGAVAYAVARAAMKSWEEEFGYELVEADVELEFPPADPQLQRELDRAIEDARQRQAALAAAMPSQFLRGAADGGFVASPTRGGFVSAGSFGGSATTARDSGGMGPPGAGGNNGFGGPDRPPTPGSGFGGSGTDASGQASTPGGSQAFPVATGSAPAGGSPGATGPPGSQSVSSADANDQAAPATGSMASVGRRQKPLADARGNNWALPKSTAQATGITRPIYVSCLVDQLIIVPEKGDSRTPAVIATPGELSKSMDEFVSAIWKHMDQWGLAVAGGYWKPVLQVTVGHGADERFEELRTVLERSGMEVTRKTR
jgi:hypothetical protein